MAISKADRVLKEIFEPLLLEQDYLKIYRNPPPSFAELKEFAQLIANDQSEESFQKFIAMHPKFLLRLSLSTDDFNIGLLAEPPISHFNTADFGILTVSQGGSRVTLIELERPSDRLFTKKLTPAKKLQTAIGQVQDWDQWIRSNKQTFVNTVLRILAALPKHPWATANGSRIFTDKKRLVQMWNGFGGQSEFELDYVIVIGRWSQLTDKEKERLIYLNRKNESINLHIRTYDNLARKAIDGPKYLW